MICGTNHSTRHGRFKPPSFEGLWDSSDGNYSIPDDEVLALAGVALGDVVDDGGLDDIARRLTASGRFETVEVHKRYRSLSATDPIALVIVVRERPRARLAGRLMFLPILGYEEGYGVSYGVFV